MSWIKVKTEADPRSYALSCTAVRCPANPPPRSYMAGSISNSDAELKVPGTHADKLSASTPISFEDANGCNKALEVIGGDPDVLVGAAEPQRRDTNGCPEVPRTHGHRRLHFVDCNLQLASAILEDHDRCLANYYSTATPSSATGCWHPTVDASISTWISAGQLHGDSRLSTPGIHC